ERAGDRHEHERQHERGPRAEVRGSAGRGRPHRGENARSDDRADPERRELHPSERALELCLRVPGGGHERIERFCAEKLHVKWTPVGTILIEAVRRLVRRDDELALRTERDADQRGAGRDELRRRTSEAVQTARPRQGIDDVRSSAGIEGNSLWPAEY